MADKIEVSQFENATVVPGEKDGIAVDGPAHLEHVAGDISQGEWKHMLQDAIEGEASERSLNWREAFRLYPKATFWSFAISLCIVM